MLGTWRVFRFKPILAPVLVRETVETILSSAKNGRLRVRLSLDLGISQSVVSFENRRVRFPDGSTVELNSLKRVRERDVYTIGRNEFEKVAFFSENRYYQLTSTGPKNAPTIGISGIHMHRIKGITPWKDSLEKVRAVGIFRGAKVLDIGTGLGYTAILSVKLGASSVLTIENDENVLQVAKVNPWSRKLADERITIVLGDASEVVNGLEDSSFHRIIHDPPRFSLAGELYSSEFYRQLFRVLKRAGNLFHYVGEPGKRRRKHMMGGVSKRLKEAGFVKPRRRAFGLIVEKPR
jgi:hypothetical protein